MSSGEAEDRDPNVLEGEKLDPTQFTQVPDTFVCALTKAETELPHSPHYGTVASRSFLEHSWQGEHFSRARTTTG